MQQATYLTSLSAWMVEQRKLLKTTRDKEVVERHDHLCSEGVQHIEEEVDWSPFDFFTV